MSFVFVKVGKRLEASVGKKMEFAGGIILILIGIKIAIEHVVKNI
jgi:putative Mn2+ efflux pump MntP